MPRSIHVSIHLLLIYADAQPHWILVKNNTKMKKQRRNNEISEFMKRWQRKEIKSCIKLVKYMWNKDETHRVKLNYQENQQRSCHLQTSQLVSWWENRHRCEENLLWRLIEEGNCCCQHQPKSLQTQTRQEPFEHPKNSNSNTRTSL